MRGPYAKSTTVKRRILDAAAATFSEQGYRGGSTAAIASRAGLSQAQLYYHFANKAEVLAAVLDDRDRIADEITGQLPDDPRGIPAAVLRVAASNQSIPGLIRLYMVLFAEASGANHPLAEHYRRRYQRLEGEFLTAFESMQQAGLLRGGIDAVYAAASTLALWDGFQLQWLIDPVRVDVVSQLRRHLAAITWVTFA